MYSSDLGRIAVRSRDEHLRPVTVVARVPVDISADEDDLVELVHHEQHDRHKGESANTHGILLASAPPHIGGFLGKLKCRSY